MFSIVFFFLCQCLLLFLTIVVLVAILRQQMIQTELSRSQWIDIERMIDSLQSGDIVFMCSRKLAWYDVYVALLNIMGNTPYFHAFLVLPSQKMFHFVHSNYQPRLQSYCTAHPESHVRTSSLHEFITDRQSLFPIYKVYRRSPVPVYESFLSSCENTCRFKFSGLLSTFFGSGAQKLHCNSFVGWMLKSIGVLSIDNSNNNKQFTPYTMQTRHLPDAGYVCVGVYTTR